MSTANEASQGAGNAKPGGEIAEPAPHPVASVQSTAPAAAPSPAQPAQTAELDWDAVLGSSEGRTEEKFIPVTRYALIDRLTRPQSWPPGVAGDVRRFFRYLDYWRQQNHNARLAKLLEDYEPFAPDSDIFMTREYSDAERSRLQKRVREGVEALLTQANYVRVAPESVEQIILTKDSHYGLDLHVDFQVFEELVIYYRGSSVKKGQRRLLSRFMRKEEFDIPIFRRVCILFKIKNETRHIEDVARQMRITREEAARYVRKLRAVIPAEVSPDAIYLKLFKNIPRTDIEMVFPNTEVRFRLRDKVWLGVSGGGALGTGVFGAAGKLALAFSNPLTAVVAAGALGSVVVRQVSNVVNTKQRYMTTMAQNLYFHAMADNRGVLTTLAERAADEDLKEEILLYSVLAKETVNVKDLGAVDEAIEHYLASAFGLEVDFDVADAFSRLMADGIVKADSDGTLRTLPPRQAAEHIDAMWDKILDLLPDDDAGVGNEIDEPGDRRLNGTRPAQGDDH